MAILINKDTRVAVQGITGRQGRFHTGAMKEYGTNIVAGITPGKGGQTVYGVPVFDTLEEAVNETEVDSTIIFVPPVATEDAVLEAIAEHVTPIIVITEHVPLHDEVFFTNLAKSHSIDIVGPNCPGVIAPGQTKIGIMPGHIFSPGPIGMVSRSGTLTYEIASALTRASLGQSTAVGIGGDPVIGINFIDVLSRFEADVQTKAIVLVGEIGGNAEEQAAEYIRHNITKPVVAYISGVTAPPGKRMGHAGAIISGSTGSAKDKIALFKKARVPVAKKPSDIPALLKQQGL
ncbi:MAG: succinate--CoA ligase subunit alpha [Candidatus Ranarchaeia archaeon]